MAIREQKITAEAFEAYAALPENEHRRLEFIDARIVEVASNLASEIALNLATIIKNYLAANPIGRLYGADAGFMMGADRMMPDIAFMSRARQPERSRATWNPRAPDLAVEVISPSDRPGMLTRKLSNYLAAGVTVWMIFPEDEEMAIHAPGKAAQTLTLQDTLTGGDLLPGFSVSVAALFADS